MILAGPELDGRPGGTDGARTTLVPGQATADDPDRATHAAAEDAADET